MAYVKNARRSPGLPYGKYKEAAFERAPELLDEYNEMSSLYNAIGDIISARAEANISQAELAKRAGMSSHTISQIELGNYNPTFKLLQRIAAALGKKLEIRIK